MSKIAYNEVFNTSKKYFKKYIICFIANIIFK